MRYTEYTEAELTEILRDQIEYDDHRGLKFKPLGPRGDEPAKPKSEKQRTCPMLTTKGRPCPLGVAPGYTYCHLHNPDGKFAMQNPAYRKRLLEEIAKSER